MSQLAVHLFGRFGILRDEQELGGFDARRTQELLSYLLLYRNQPHPRETLAGILWGDSPNSLAKKSLRQALWHLQAALESQTAPNQDRILAVEPDWVRVNAQASLWLDVGVFEEAYTLAQGIPGQKLDPTCAQRIRSAVDLYKGNLLEGWYQDWCLCERERFQSMYLAMLDKLVVHCEAHNEYEMGMLYGMRILRYDRARERTHRQLMRLYYRAGDRASALRQYDRCVTALHDELGVTPSKRTMALYEVLQADDLDDLGDSTAAVGSPTEGLQALSPVLTDILRQLEQLSAVLASTRHHLQHEIQMIEQTLSGQRYTPIS